MKKKKIIMDTIGVAVQKQGFTYGVPGEYDDPPSWGFTREVGEVKQMIIVSEHRFQKEVCIQFQTTARRKSMISQEEFEHLYGDGKHVGSYETKEEFREIMIKFVEFIEEYGYKHLDATSIEEGIFPTLEMANTLMASHEELNEKFIKENGLDVRDRSKVNISRWFEVIEEKLRESKDEPYGKVQGLLVEIAAFIGEQLRMDLGGEWKQEEMEPSGVGIKGMNCFLQKSYGVLTHVVFAWEDQSIKRVKQSWGNKSIKRVKQNYVFMLDGKLPMTIEQMEEYTKNQNNYFT